MLLSILVVLVIVTAAAGVFWLIVGQRQDDVVDWIGQSWKEWKSEGDDAEEYTVEMKDANIGEIFSAFGTDDAPAYYTPELVEDQWNRVVDAERSAVSHIRARFQRQDSEGAHEEAVGEEQNFSSQELHEQELCKEEQGQAAQAIQTTRPEGQTSRVNPENCDEESGPSFRTVRSA